MPGSHRLRCYLKTDHTPVGFLEEHDDGYPRLGTLVIQTTDQRQGLGSETFHGLVDYAHGLMAWARVRAGIKAVNAGGLAFLKHLGFQIIEEGSERFAGGLQHFYVMEYAIKQ